MTKTSNRKFAWIMILLSIIAVLMGVVVFYWLLQYEPVRSTELASTSLLFEFHITHRFA